MHRRLSVGACVWVLAAVGAAGATIPGGSPQLVKDLALRFEPNRGQAETGARFTSRGAGYRIDLFDSRHVLRFGADNVTTRLVNASRAVRVEGVDPHASRSHYLIGNDPSRWKTDVPNFRQVRYSAIYPGIDLVFYGKDGKLEYDFIVSPGADPGQVALSIDGAREVSIEESGDLLIRTAKGEVRWNRPYVYQAGGGAAREIAGRFVRTGRTGVKFEIGSYDRTRPLVIDPVLSYSTYHGATGNDAARAIAVDASGNVYIAGNTSSQTLPTTAGSAQAAYGGDNPGHQETGDAFIAKFTPAGALTYVTYLGGGGDEAALGIVADAAGNAYVTGYTNSANFRTTAGAYQTAFAGQGRGSQYHEGGDAFVVKLNPAGSTLLYSTFLGGSLDDRGVDRDRLREQSVRHGQHPVHELPRVRRRVPIAISWWNVE